MKICTFNGAINDDFDIESFDFTTMISTQIWGCKKEAAENAFKDQVIF